MNQHFAIVGMGRSGTTFLDKLLASSPHLSVLSQPFPLLYTAVKRAFWESRGLAVPHNVLGHYFGDSETTPDSFADYLVEARFEHDYVRQLLESMVGYSGQYAAVDPSRLTWPSDGLPLNLSDLYRLLLEVYRHRDQAHTLGSKETHTEEFMPYWLDSGIRVIQMLRNPLDVIASFNLGSGEAFAGRARPTLFLIRNWRKSVAFALRYLSHPLLKMIRYEDLVASPSDTLADISEFLDLPAGSRLAGAGEDLLDQDGKPWKRNSSHAGKQARLEPSVAAYIERLCAPEMQVLGYEARATANDKRSDLQAFVEPRPIERPEFAVNYSTDPRNLAEEARRLELWEAVQGPPSSLVRQYFLFDESFKRLQAREGLFGR